MSDRRRNVRVTHRESIRFDTDNGSLSAESLDLSRTGMQIRVELPPGAEGPRSISFTLPNAERPVRIPVRLARQEAESAAGDRYRLGLEFEFDTDDQMRLIDQYIRESEELLHRDSEGAGRQIPRCDCGIEAVSPTRGVEAKRVTNISTEGLMFSFSGGLHPEQNVELSFTLPGERRPTAVRGEVAYVIQESGESLRRAGIRFTKLKEVDRARIRNFVLGATSSNSMRNLHSRLAKGEVGEGFSLDSGDEIRTLFSRVFRGGRPIHLLPEGARQIGVFQLAGIDDEPARLVLEGSEEPELRPKPGTTVYGSFTFQRGSYLFSARLQEHLEGGVAITVPDIVFRSEKRSYQRKGMDGEETIRIHLDGFPDGLQARLLDLSWRGFLCAIDLDGRVPVPLTKGQLLSYEVDPALGLDPYGQIRHMSVRDLSGGRREIQLGVEAGVRRSSFAFTRIDEKSWTEAQEAGCPEEGGYFPFETRKVRLRNRRGEEIVALLNSTGGSRGHVVLIPPAFGKKKETLAPLAATLLANAREHELPLTVVRFDGINRPGESHNDDPNAARGYEMLRYRPRQGVDDIGALLDYIYDNPHFEPDGVTLFTSSMSSVDARKYLATRDAGRVTAWVSLMGVPAARTTLSNILAGTDIIANAKMGIKNGVRGMLGHLVDMDSLAVDLIEEKYAYLTDARQEMARIGIPVLWIYGAHDHWVEPEQVEDVMSIDAGARRELLEVPTGHNLRGSRDAIEVFKRAARFIFRTAKGIEVDPIAPNKAATLEMVSREREQLEKAQEIELSGYWKEYLLGNERNREGYDFYRNFPEFVQFMARQVELLELEGGEVIADMGCGTGLVTEAILRHSAATGRIPSRIVGFDLISEALDRARETCRKVQAELPGTDGCVVEFHQADLEPSKLLPIEEFLNAEEFDLRILRHRIEGLTTDYLDRLEAARTPELESYLRGQRLSANGASAPADPLDTDLREVAQELHAAAAALRQGAADGRTGKLHLLDEPGRRGLELEAGSLDRIVASLFISYLRNPDYLIAQFRTFLKPGGMLAVSSMRPDSDVSAIFTGYVSEVQRGAGEGSRELEGAQAILSEAAALFELEEEGFFLFYTEEELRGLLEAAGFVNVRSYRSLGSPSQAVIAVGEAP